VLTKDSNEAVEPKTTIIHKKSSLSEQVSPTTTVGFSARCRYGLPKIRKEDVPLRPIVIIFEASIYRLDQHLAGFFGGYLGNSPHYVTN
jgi:hypothetical protein